MSLERLSRISAGAAIIFSAFVSFQAHADTLRGVVQHTIKTNPDVLVAAKIKHATKQQVDQARAGFFPTLDIYGFLGREHTENNNSRFVRGDDDGVTLWRHDLAARFRQNLFRGWLDYYEVKRTKAKTDADSWQVCGAAQDVAMQTTESYLNVLREQRKIGVGQGNLKEHQRIFNMIKERSRSGVGREADIAQATGRLALAKSNFYTIQNEYNNSKVDYFKVTGVEARSLVMPRDPSNSMLPKSRANAIYQALKFHPKMRLSVVDVEERRAQHSASHFTAFPQLDLVVEANDGRNFNGSRALQDRYFAGLELHYNLFNGGADVARQRETAYLTQEAAEIRNRTCREVTEKVSLAWNNVQTARIRLSQLEQHKVSAAKTKVAYEEQFKLGKRTLFDLLDSQNEAFTSNLAYVNGIYEVYIMEYRLLHATGRLVEYLGTSTPNAAHPEYAVYDYRANPINAKRHFDARIWDRDRPSKWYNPERIETEEFSNCIECSQPTHARYATKDVCMPSHSVAPLPKCGTCSGRHLSLCDKIKHRDAKRADRRVKRQQRHAQNKTMRQQKRIAHSAKNATKWTWNGKPWNSSAPSAARANQIAKYKHTVNTANAKSPVKAQLLAQSNRFGEADHFDFSKFKKKPVRLASANTTGTPKLRTHQPKQQWNAAQGGRQAHKQLNTTAQQGQQAHQKLTAKPAQHATFKKHHGANKATVPAEKPEGTKWNKATDHQQNVNAADQKAAFADHPAHKATQQPKIEQRSQLNPSRSDLRTHERKIVNAYAASHQRESQKVAHNAKHHQKSLKRSHARAKTQHHAHKRIAHKAPVKTFKSTVSGWAIDVGRFHDTAEINEVVATLKNSGFNGFFKEIRTPTSLTYELFVGPAKNKEQANNMVAKLKNLNINGKVVRTDHTA